MNETDELTVWAGGAGQVPAGAAETAGETAEGVATEEAALAEAAGGACETLTNDTADSAMQAEASAGGACETLTNDTADSAMQAEKAATDNGEETATDAEDSATDNAGDSATDAEGANAPLSESEMAAILADPMFLPFARGKGGDIMTLCRNFREMLSAGGVRAASSMTASVTARMTPTSVSAFPEVALNEHQRALARAAGMTYREYFELASDIPNTILHHK